MGVLTDIVIAARDEAQQVAEAAAGVDGVGEVEVNLAWDPPWTKDMMSDEAKVALDLF